jgi:Tfp pilus assembly protein PilO
MSVTRKWSLLTAVLIIGVLAASWFVLVAPKRSAAADLRDQATKQQADNQALVQQLSELKAQSLDLPNQKAKLAVLGKQVPDNPALPTLIRDLTAAGRKVGVQVLSMKPGVPALAVVAAPAVPVAAPATTTSTTSATAGTVTPAPVAPAALYVVPLSLDVTGSYFEVEQFINKLEDMQRKFLLTGFTLKASDGAGATGSTVAVASGGMDLTLTGQIFLAPNVASSTSTPAAAPAAAPAQ